MKAFNDFKLDAISKLLLLRKRKLNFRAAFLSVLKRREQKHFDQLQIENFTSLTVNVDAEFP